MTPSQVIQAGLTLAAACVGVAADDYEAFYLYLGDRPSEGNPGWHENGQGLAHDEDHWFITQADRIWKIPVEHNLAVPAGGAPGVIVRSLSSYSELGAYNHFGDLVHFHYRDTGYLLVPLEGPGISPALAVFRADDLTHVDRVSLSLQSFGWCAVSPDGDVYTSHNSASSFLSSFLRYTVDWELLWAANDLEITSGPIEIPFYTESGAPLQLRYAQGGEFSPGGDLLYFVTGYYTDTDDLAEGIHVFDTSTWRRIQHSTNGYGHFNYEFHTGFDTYEEPEGLTVWDLDDGRAPGILGQLHVMMVDNDELSADDVYVKHYTHIIRVDAGNYGFQDGTPASPFNTVTGAINYSWDGAEVRMLANTYNEPMTISKRVRLTAEGGVVRIGG